MYKTFILSSIIVNGQLQPRFLLAFFGYATLATKTADNERDEEAEESKEKIRDYRHRRGGQLYSSFHDQFMLKFQTLDAVTFHAMFRMSQYAYNILRNLSHCSRACFISFTMAWSVSYVKGSIQRFIQLIVSGGLGEEEI